MAASESTPRVNRSGRNGLPADMVTAKLPNGTWVAVEVRPGCYATGKTKAAAEAAIRRKTKFAEVVAKVDEDAIDRAIIRKRKREKLIPFEKLEADFLKK
jgi:hypothetical protein